MDNKFSLNTKLSRECRLCKLTRKVSQEVIASYIDKKGNKEFVCKRHLKFIQDLDKEENWNLKYEMLNKNGEE